MIGKLLQSVHCSCTSGEALDCDKHELPRLDSPAFLKARTCICGSQGCRLASAQALYHYILQQCLGSDSLNFHTLAILEYYLIPQAYASVHILLKRQGHAVTASGLQDMVERIAALHTLSLITKFS